jgi:hypothetical protein
VVNQSTAEDNCKRYGGHLAAYTSIEEQMVKAGWGPGAGGAAAAALMWAKERLRERSAQGPAWAAGAWLTRCLADLRGASLPGGAGGGEVLH